MRDFAASTTATDVAPNVSPTWEAYSAETVTLFNADAGAVCFCRMALAAPPVGARGGARGAGGILHRNTL